jgi:hypothetical protein
MERFRGAYAGKAIAPIKIKEPIRSIDLGIKVNNL